MNDRTRFWGALQFSADACNLASLLRCSIRVVVGGILVASCSAWPVCRPELVEQEGRCVAKEAPALQCEPACSATLHEVCDDDAESPSCVCAPGYGGNPCEWGGVLKDRGFQDQDAWTLSGGANVNQFETDVSVDRGFAEIERSAACNAGAVSQTVQMPSYEAGEPLVAEVTYRSHGLYGLALGFNRAWTQFEPTSLEPTPDDVWRTERVCLGEAAYGGAVTVQLSAPEQHFSCFDEPEGEINVDRLDIVPADPGECPAPGEVPNGAADVGEGGWQFETEGAAVAELAGGVGRNASSGVRLASDGFDLAFAWSKLSIPSSESLQSPAIRFWWRGTNGRPFRFYLGRYDRIGSGTGRLPLDVVYGNGTEVNYVYCLPPWTHGNVVDLIFRTWADGSTSPRELVIDDVELVSDARCGTSTDLLDPGFDAGPAQIMGVTHFTPYSSATLRTEPSLSRTEDGGVLELSYWSEEAVMYLETWALVPESNGDDGPALTFWSKIPASNKKPFWSVKGRAAVDPAFLPAGGGWQQSDPICIPPEWSGRWYRLQWRLGDNPPMGTLQIDPVRIYIDDLELTTDAACPSRSE